MPSDGRPASPVRIAIVSGIFPPDVGGPATHAADLLDELTSRGHPTTVVTLTDGHARVDGPNIVRFPRGRSWPARHASVVWWLVAHRSTFDVIYATGLLPAAVLGGRLAGRPVVAKVVGDPVWERARRLGLTGRSFETFQDARPLGLRIRAMRWVRDSSLRHATAVITPSNSLERSVERWLGGPSDVAVVPNGVRMLERSRRTPNANLRVITMGRLVEVKRVDRLIEAVSAVDGTTLDVVGDGPERAAWSSVARDLGVLDRVRFVGDVPHAEALARLSKADVLAMASEIEGLPHVVIEALAMGTPVLAPAVGGVQEAVRDDENGLLLEDASVERLVAALRRLRSEAGLRERLARGALRDGPAWTFERTADAVEEVLQRALKPRPRIVLVGKSRLPGPERAGALLGDLRPRYEVLAERVDPIVVGVGRPGVRWVGRAELLVFPDLRPKALGGALFYALAPIVGIMRAAGGRRPAAVMCQSPYEAVGVELVSGVVPKRFRPAVIVEVHGDWRVTTRLYGSSLRRFAAPLADRLAVAAIRRADRVRAIGAFTEALVRETGYDGPIERFVTYSDFSSFLASPVIEPPEGPIVAFLGGDDRVKGGDVLLAAWPRVRDAVPDARLRVAGGSIAGNDDGIAFLGRLSRAEVADELDRALVLVVPSRSEGLGRVVLEAHARGRPVVATRVGGLPELVEDGVTGLLVEPDDPAALADAVAALLADHPRAVAMGAEARRRVEERDPAGEFADGIDRIARWVER
jgi:glycosyltransferase involved in cell wall biosynthesis